MSTYAKFGLPNKDGEITQLGFGAMGLSAFYGQTDSLDEQRAVLLKAIEIGCTTINTADMYANGANEELIGSVAQMDNNREKMFIITKFGNRWTEGVPGWKVDGSVEYVKSAIDASIKRLGSAPDAWAMHRMDPNVPIEETVAEMQRARQAGKCKYLGLSECSVATLRRANAVARIDFIEVEYSPWTLDMEENGILAACRELKIIVLAYSPLGRGFLTGRYKSPADFAKSGDYRGMLPRMQEAVWEQNFKIVTAFQELAAKKGCTSSQLCLAWLMAQGSNITPIPGTKSQKYLIENFAAQDLVLSVDELKEIRSVINSHRPEGDRYTKAAMATLNL